MIVKAGNGCYLTESYDTPIENRRFEKQVIVSSAEELSMWREITETEKDKMITDWTAWDLSSLGEVVEVKFDMTGDVENEYSFSMPTYYAIDDVTVEWQAE